MIRFSEASDSNVSRQYYRGAVFNIPTENILKLTAVTSLKVYRSQPFFFFPVPVCAITATGVPGDTFVSMNRFSTLCG
jgi:hypothetical protein